MTVFCFQAYRKVGVFQTAFWCQRDPLKSFSWRMHEIYIFATILAFPSVVMSVAYGVIAKEMCRSEPKSENIANIR